MIAEYCTALQQFRKMRCRQFVAKGICSSGVRRRHRTFFKHGADRKTFARPQIAERGVVSVRSIKSRYLYYAALDDVEHRRRALRRVENDRTFRVVAEIDMRREEAQRIFFHLPERRIPSQKIRNSIRNRRRSTAGTRIEHGLPPRPGSSANANQPRDENQLITVTLSAFDRDQTSGNVPVESVRLVGQVRRHWQRDHVDAFFAQRRDFLGRCRPANMPLRRFLVVNPSHFLRESPADIFRILDDA